MQELLSKESKRGKPGFVTEWRDTVVLEKHIKLYAKHNYIPEQVPPLDIYPLDDAGTRMLSTLPIGR